MFANITLKAQQRIPVLKSTRSTLDIREGEFLYKEIWNVSVEAKPDIFISNPFSKKQKIVFYSDIDSISFEVKPNKKYDFVVLLNGKDSAFTQIDTYPGKSPSITPKLFYSRKDKKIKPNGPDSIHFTIGTDHGIHFKGRINDSELLDFSFDTGASAIVIGSSLANNKIKVSFDGSQLNKGSDGAVNVNTSSGNKMEVDGMMWNNVSLLSVNNNNFPFEVIMGWIAFEDKIVEINYDRKYLIIHDNLETIPKEYSKSEMKLIGGIPYIKCKLVVNGKIVEGWFDFDTGSSANLFVSQQFATDNKLNNIMPVIGTGKTTGTGGAGFNSNVVLLPKLQIGDFEMYQVPLSIATKDPADISNNENIGNKILKRFNVILDFKSHLIYLKPNSLFYSPIM